jgi:hypothetical protein
MSYRLFQTKMREKFIVNLLLTRVSRVSGSYEGPRRDMSGIEDYEIIPWLCSYRYFCQENVDYRANRTCRICSSEKTRDFFTK